MQLTFVYNTTWPKMVTVYGVIELVEIPNNKSQKTKKSQHAAHAQRVTEIQNPKQKNNRFASGP